jgi:hypothetical protein
MDTLICIGILIYCAAKYADTTPAAGTGSPGIMATTPAPQQQPAPYNAPSAYTPAPAAATTATAPGGGGGGNLHRTNNFVTVRYGIQKIDQNANPAGIIFSRQALIL